MVLSAVHKDDAQGVPHYMGMKGKNLSIMLSTVATCGFLLFGCELRLAKGSRNQRHQDTDTFMQTIRVS